MAHHGHRLDLADGAAITADLVVGADGAWSRARAAVTDTAVQYTGVTSVEACLHRAAERHPQALAAVGTGAFFVPGQGSAIVGHHEATGTIRPRAMIDVPAGWSPDLTGPAGLRTLLAHYDGWAPALRSLLAESDEPWWSGRS